MFFYDIYTYMAYKYYDKAKIYSCDLHFLDLDAYFLVSNIIQKILSFYTEYISIQKMNYKRNYFLLLQQGQ